MNVEDDCTLQIKTLGSFEVCIDGARIPEKAWPRRKTKELLKLLLTRPGKPFTTEQLIDALLPDADVSTASANIQARVSELRRVLEPGLARGRDSQYIRRIGEGYAFDPNSDCLLDTSQFAAAIAEAQRTASDGQGESAIEHFETVLLLYSGEFLVEERYASWAETARQHFREQYLDALTRLAECYSKLGRLRQAISCCERILSVEPHREAIIRQMMEYQHQAGYRTQALETFNEGEAALREHLDVEPSPETKALRDRIQAGDVDTVLDLRRIAVLPFQNYSPNPDDEYLADGMSEELIGHLARIRDLRVIARTSMMRFKGTSQPISQISRVLDVGSILEGSVRRAGDQVRISAQLIDTRTEEHIWANEYEGQLSSVFTAQKAIARKVAEALKIVLLRDEVNSLDRNVPTTSDAYSTCLRGRNFFNKHTADDHARALTLFEEAISLDPQLAEAHVGAGLCYNIMGGWGVSGNDFSLSEGYAKARLAVLRALEINPELPYAHVALATILSSCEHRESDAETSIKRAIHLSPSSVGAHRVYCNLLLCMNRIDEALAEARCALDLNPVSPVSHSTLALALIEARRLDEAQRIINQGIDLDPSYRHLFDYQARIHWLRWDWKEAQCAAKRFVDTNSYPVNDPLYRGIHSLYLGQISDALAEFPRMMEFPIGDDRMTLQYGLALYLAREYEQVSRLMKDLLDANALGIHHAGRSWFHLWIGLALEQLGRDEEAISMLEKAREGLPEWVFFTFSRGPILADVAEALIQIRQGQQDGPRWVIQKLSVRSDEREVCSALAILHIHLGRVDEGFKWLQTALDQHDEFLLTIKTHPWLDLVRDDPRFTDILKQMNLAD